MILEIIQRISKSRFFSREQRPYNFWQIIAWWEVRRIPYNLLVGVMGIISVALSLVATIFTEHYLGQPIGLPDPPIFIFIAVISYAVLVNICYTGGWLIELIVDKVWPDQGKSFGPISFSLGVAFSIFITLLPGILAIIVSMIFILDNI